MNNLRKPLLLVPLVLAAVVAVAFVFYSPPSDAKPSVSWSPASIPITVEAGQSTTTSATFTATENASNATVEVVPALAPYVKVVPSSFTSITKGSSYTVALTVSASTSASMGTTTGTIHIRQGTSTLAKPLPMSVTVVWPTFNGGEELGFSIQYPPGWIIDNTYEQTIAFKNSDNLSLPREDLAFFRVLRLVNANPPELPINEWFDAYFSLGFSSEITTREALVIDGRDAVRVTYTGIGTHVATYIFDGLDVLNISYDLDNSRFLADYETMLQSLSL